ncbi:MAG: 4Fe-4S binding protein [Elusimicrobiota bacterium]
MGKRQGIKQTPVAVVEGRLCLACGTCAAGCPQWAIHVDETASVNPAKCDGCGVCVERCDEDAISLKPRL